MSNLFSARKVLAPLSLSLVLAGGLAVVGCDNRSDAERSMDRAGNKVENAAEKAGDKTKDAAEKVGDKASDAGDKVKDATHDAADNVRDAAK